MKLIYIVRVPPLPAIVLEVRLTQMSVLAAVLLAPLSIHASNGPLGPLDPTPVLNSTFDQLAFMYG